MNTEAMSRLKANIITAVLVIQLMIGVLLKASDEENPLVYVEQGALRGRIVSLQNGRSYNSFQGVPYAKPPVGPLRFKIAEKPEPWEKIRDATKEGNACIQVDWMLHRPNIGEEDCLYLNIYSPKLLTDDEKYKMAVMVFIHGGGFDAGSGNTDFHGPEYFMEEDIVLVTINYRLGVLGFLSLEDPEHTDNLGLKDQVAALQWIKDNIKVFGGDPNDITIFGESAGGASVHFHMLSPMSKGLFQKAISQSGSALNGWSVAVKPKSIAVQLVKELGSDVDDTSEILDFLNTIPARTLVHTYGRVKQKKRGRKWSRFGPVPETQKDNVFVPANLREMIDKGMYHDVPTIFGSNSEEGIIILHMSGILKQPSILRLIGKHFDTQIPDNLSWKSNRKEITDKLKKFYFGNKLINESSQQQYAELASDEWFTYDINRAVRSQVGKSCPTFYYNFAYDGSMNILKQYLNITQIKGVSHMDEMGYLFPTSFIDLKSFATETDFLIQKRMTKMWSNFAKTGNPTPDTDSLLEITWPPYKADDPVYLNIDKTLSIGKNLYENKMMFWDDLYKT